MLLDLKSRIESTFSVNGHRGRRNHRKTQNTQSSLKTGCSPYSWHTGTLSHLSNWMCCLNPRWFLQRVAFFWVGIFKLSNKEQKPFSSSFGSPQLQLQLVSSRKVIWVTFSIFQYFFIKSMSYQQISEQSQFVFQQKIQLAVMSPANCTQLCTESVSLQVCPCLYQAMLYVTSLHCTHHTGVRGSWQ